MKLVHGAIAFTSIALLIGCGTMVNDQAGKRIMAESLRHTAAFSNFYTQYDALPGDMPNATDFWGIAGGTTGNDIACYSVDSRTLADPKRTCNGNGNQLIFHKDILRDQSAPEWFRAWQHMVNAGFMEGHFSGKADGKPRRSMPGVNVPVSTVVPGAGYTLMNFHQLDHPKWFPGHYLGLAFGTPFTNPIGLEVETRGGAITSQLASSIDAKFDDGSPSSGTIRSFRDLPQCVAREDRTAPYRYLNDTTIKGCGLFFAFRDPGFTDFPLRP